MENKTYQEYWKMVRKNSREKATKKLGILDAVVKIGSYIEVVKNHFYIPR